MNKKGQLGIDFGDIIKLIGVIIIAFFVFALLSSVASNLQISLDSIITMFVPLIILAIIFEFIRKVFA